MAREDWIWMPHAAHLCISDWCRFRLATYVNGHIVSTVGEYLPDSDARRCILESRLCRGFCDEKEKEKIVFVLSKRGDDFDRYYLRVFGFDDIGHNRKYETMVFGAKESENGCCPYEMGDDLNFPMEGYNFPHEATKGHYMFCEKYDIKKGQ